MKLSDNAKYWYKWYSTYTDTINGAMLSSWLLVPQEWKAAIPTKVVIALALIFLALSFIAKLIHQDLKIPPASDNPAQ
jgi:hypothetical protein